METKPLALKSPSEIKTRTKQFYNRTRRRKNKELKQQHRCIWCKKKVKPVTTYPNYCEEHSYKNRKLKKERER